MEGMIGDSLGPVGTSMSRDRTISCLQAVLASLTLATACGSGANTTAPVSGPPSPTTVTISPAEVVLTALGVPVQLAAEVRDQNGRVMAGPNITWRSSDPAVATVDASGRVTGVGGGVTAISASAGEASGSAVVTVVQAAASVVVSPSSEEITRGDRLQLVAEALDANGHVVLGAQFSWESNDTSVATVNTSGLVVGVGAGVATIRASADAATGATVVTVRLPAVSVVISPSAETIGVGTKLQLFARAFDAGGHTVHGVSFSWESSDNAVATVDTTGLVAGVSEGAAIVTAKVERGQGTSMITVGPHPDRAALVALYEATDGQRWATSFSSNWLTDAPLGEWHGVNTDDFGRVIGLRLFEIGLTGTIPPELGNLTNLTSLSLGGNNLSGPIPRELGNLTNLTSLDLGDNERLSGPIPSELGELVNLEILWLYLNNLSGTIPPELGNLTKLEVLLLSSNDLSGTIPPELGNLDHLKRLRLEYNNLSGPLPSELGNLSNLSKLYLFYNALTGPIPESFLKLDKLTGFDFRDNAGLCAPSTTAFVNWMDSIRVFGSRSAFGPYCTPNSSMPNQRD